MSTYSQTASNKSAGDAALAADYNKLVADLANFLTDIFGSPTAGVWSLINAKFDQISEQTPGAGVMVQGILIDHLNLRGVVVPFSGSSAPAGWLFANGQSVSRTTYAGLFATINTQFGSVDGTHFNLPNLNGRIPVGLDSSQPGVFDSLGLTGGQNSHVLTVNELAPHTHTQSVSNTHNVANGTGWGTVGTGSDPTGSTGSGAAHNNLQPYITLNYIIKY